MHLHGEIDPDTEVFMLETIEHLLLAQRSADREGTRFSWHLVISSPNEMREWLTVAMGVINTMTQLSEMTDEEISNTFEMFRNGVKEGK